MINDKISSQIANCPLISQKLTNINKIEIFDANLKIEESKLEIITLQAYEKSLLYETCILGQYCIYVPVNIKVIASKKVIPEKKCGSE